MGEINVQNYPKCFVFLFVFKVECGIKTGILLKDFLKCVTSWLLVDFFLVKVLWKNYTVSLICARHQWSAAKCRWPGSHTWASSESIVVWYSSLSSLLGGAVGVGWGAWSFSSAEWQMHKRPCATREWQQDTEMLVVIVYTSFMCKNIQLFYFLHNPQPKLNMFYVTCESGQNIPCILKAIKFK